MSERVYQKVLAAVFVGVMAVAVVGMGWGLPNGNRTWAGDAVAPMTPLAVAYHVFLEDGANSGYFYFKYPVGHQLLLAALSTPVLAVAWASGGLHGIATDYPYGFDDPEAYLVALGLVARGLSALLAAGLVLTVAGITRRLVGDTAGHVAGIFAALTAAGSYPLVFYAHTSNVEMAFLFWAFLALYATVRGLDEEASPRWFWLLGAAAAMAVSTKEQIVGFLALLPVVIVGMHMYAHRRQGRFAPLPRGVISGAALCLLVVVVANAAYFNPAGFVNRLRFLTHTLAPEVREQYAPYEFPIDFSTTWTAADELTHIGKAARAVASSLGWPAFLVGLAGMILMATRNRRALLFTIAPLVGYYAISLRALKQVEIRYTMPLSTLLAIPAGYLLATLWRRSRAWRAATVALVVGGLLYSSDVVLMLVDDARYEAEAWMAPHLAAGRTVEVYQSWTYLPRWQRTEGVTKPAFEEITRADLAERAPDFVVISSKAKEGMTMYPNPDWRDGRGMMLEAGENRLVLEGLENETLGYTPTITFAHSPLFERELITSLNPAITIYARDGMSPQRW